MEAIATPGVSVHAWMAGDGQGVLTAEAEAEGGFGAALSRATADAEAAGPAIAAPPPVIPRSVPAAPRQAVAAQGAEPTMPDLASPAPTGRTSTEEPGPHPAATNPRPTAAPMATTQGHRPTFEPPAPAPEAEPEGAPMTPTPIEHPPVGGGNDHPEGPPAWFPDTPEPAPPTLPPQDQAAVRSSPMPLVTPAAIPPAGIAIGVTRPVAPGRDPQVTMTPDAPPESRLPPADTARDVTEGSPVAGSSHAAASVTLPSVPPPSVPLAGPTVEAPQALLQQVMDGIAGDVSGPRLAGAGEVTPAAASPAPPPPPPARQVATMAIALAFAPNLGQFRVALEPAELGRVDIMVRRLGEVHQVLIVAERPETLALLQRDRAELDRALTESGVAVEDAGIGFALESGQDHPSQQGFQRNGAPARPPSAAIATPNEPQHAPRGLLDLNV